MNTDNLSNQQLLNNTRKLVRKEHEITAEILEHLQEIERRKLYSELKYGSLFEYCLKELKYSETQTYRRIDAMKLARNNSKIKDEINSGNLTLTNVNQISGLFKIASFNNSDKNKIVDQIIGTTKKECEEVIDKIKESKGIIESSKKEVNQKDGDRVRLHISLDKITVKKLKHLKGLLAHKKNYKTVTMQSLKGC